MGKTKLATISEQGDTKPKETKKKPEKKDKIHLSGLKGGQRVKVIEAEPVPSQQELAATNQSEKSKRTRERHRGEKYLAALAKIDPKKKYALADAAKLLKETSISSFPGSVELHLVLARDGVNNRIELPYSTGKTKKIEIADEATVEKLKEGKIDFDILLASPDMMPKLVPFAKLLGPRGLMPNPKNGTLVPDPKKVLDQFGTNQIVVKTEKAAPLTHNVVAKVSQPENEIEENIKAVINNVGKSYIKKAFVSPTMGPGIQISL